MIAHGIILQNGSGYFQRGFVRILHLVNHCNHGHGNAHVAIDLACVQAAEGDELMYVSAGGDYVDLFPKYGVVHEKVALNVRNPFLAAQSLVNLVRICRKFRPEIIHAHMMASAAFGFIAAIACGARLVTTVHNSFDKHSWLMRLGHRVVAVSNAERVLLLSQGYKARRVSVVINGPNNSPREHFLDIDDRARLKDVENPCVMTVCGLHQRKGVHDLIRGFTGASAENPDWKLYIIGDGPDRALLSGLVDELLMTEKIKFLGSVGTPKHLLEKADIFALASYADPCSLAVAEARGAGCAIVATAVGGTPELLDQGNGGILVQPGFPQQLSDALSPLMRDRKVLASWRARSSYNADYLDVRRVVKDHRAVYASVLAE